MSKLIATLTLMVTLVFTSPLMAEEKGQGVFVSDLEKLEEMAEQADTLYVEKFNQKRIREFDIRATQELVQLRKQLDSLEMDSVLVAKICQDMKLLLAKRGSEKKAMMEYHGHSYSVRWESAVVKEYVDALRVRLHIPIFPMIGNRVVEEKEYLEHLRGIGLLSP